MKKLLVASRNQKKLGELQRILAGSPDLRDIELLSLNDVPEYPEAPEKGLTFAENALMKAREGAKYTGLPTVGDDSGLAVDFMNGMPGVLSARWAGRHGDDKANLDLLLAQLSDVDEPHRGAQFVCAIALALPGGKEHLVHGKMPGRLIRSPRGAGGFGYDPIFVADGHTLTSAELDPDAKDAISHRGQALRALATVIAKTLN
ncbi:RdgB/HAM1 family non-canonical purine NTP pyrophosphatase [Catelliglobosispora koreensis]|uniref:RdgB/HAM1 family non-canonical purine NTP pyrophosphatase n=1 Tax=Catelliglobosispora koreensis TaxID=129052 RepID=UPI00035D5E38|nr:RdgB/HAM1 family non-canonical purine NTP pyrophosphatase [Catelliglobosispora koreensis]